MRLTNTGLPYNWATCLVISINFHTLIPILILVIPCWNISYKILTSSITMLCNNNTIPNKHSHYGNYTDFNTHQTPRHNIPPYTTYNTYNTSAYSASCVTLLPYWKPSGRLAHTVPSYTNQQTLNSGTNFKHLELSPGHVASEHGYRQLLWFHSYEDPGATPSKRVWGLAHGWHNSLHRPYFIHILSV